MAKTSPEAEAMVNAGAKPNDVDVEAMLKTMRQMQAQIDALNAERGVPSDPVDAAVKDLDAHVKARKDGNPTLDVAELQDALKKASTLSEDGALNWEHVDLIHTHVEDLLDANPQLRHELTYLLNLSRSLKKEHAKANA